MAKKISKREIPPDPVYSNEQVQKFINHVMRRGKKTVAMKVVYDAFDIIKKKTKKEPVEVFEEAIRNASPSVEVRARRIGGATYQVPIEVRGERKITLAMRWIIESAKKRKGKPMREKLAEELMNAAENTGEAIKKKINLRRVAEANKAFSHFAW